jgi:DNA-binding NarL/FixJ family response regulator
MESFLLIISFLLHLVTLTIIFQFFKQRSQPKSGTQTEELVTLLETYLQEVKEENDRLQEAISSEKDKATSVPKGVSNEPVRSQANDDYSEQENSSYTPPAPIEEDQVEASLQSRILQLHHRGKSNTEIAKQLDCGKTEVELIIKLYAKNGE